jgi:hypothetical protein
MLQAGRALVRTEDAAHKDIGPDDGLNKQVGVVFDIFFEIRDAVAFSRPQIRRECFDVRKFEPRFLLQCYSLTSVHALERLLHAVLLQPIMTCLIVAILGHKDLSRGEAHNYSMEVRSDLFESAKSHFFDTSSWGEFCDVTLTWKQAWQPDRGGWLKIDDYRCRQAFRHFMNLLNRAVYGSAFRRHRKRLRVLPVLEKGWVRARALRPWECGASGRWHIHCAIELPSHFDAITLEKMIRECWAKVEWGHGRILVRDGANASWIDYMLKDRQRSEFDVFLDCIIIESLHNPIADA